MKNRKVLVVYDTKYGSTAKICSWLADCLGNTVEIARVNEVKSLDYALIVVGSPIYNEMPLPSVVDFLRENKEELKLHKLAYFVVCGDTKPDRYSGTCRGELYLNDLKGQVEGEVILDAIFGGYFDIDELDKEDRKAIEDFSKQIGRLARGMNKLDRDEVNRFGQRLKEIVAKPV